MNLRLGGLLLLVLLGALVLHTQAALEGEGRELLWENEKKEKKYRRKHRKHKKAKSSAKPYKPVTKPPSTARPYAPVTKPKPTTAAPYVPPKKTTKKSVKPYVPPKTTTKKSVKPYVPPKTRALPVTVTTPRPTRALPVVPSTVAPFVPGAVVLHGEQVEQCDNEAGFFKVGGNPPVLDCVCCPNDPRGARPGGCGNSGVAPGPAVAGIANCAFCNDFLLCERCVDGRAPITGGTFVDSAGDTQGIRLTCPA